MSKMIFSVGDSCGQLSCKILGVRGHAPPRRFEKIWIALAEFVEKEK